MIDDDVFRAVRKSLVAARDSLADVRMGHPAEKIIARARRRRLRHRLTAAAAAAGAAALAVTALLPGGGTSTARLAAWTVTARPGGQVAVTIRELSDAAGLQRTLRADGVPAIVRFGINNNPKRCLYYPLSPRRDFRLQAKIFPQDIGNAQTDAFTIDTTAIPPGIGLWITVTAPKTLPSSRGVAGQELVFGWALIYASGRCPAA